MIKLRELEEKDANLMLELMHDPDIQKGFKRRMMDATLEDVIRFIKGAVIPATIENGANLHFAIVNEEDEYLGTVSLKNVDVVNKTAEYAIILRRIAQGCGVGYEATNTVLEKAFSEMGLNRVYLSVYSNNTSAIKLYEKCGFRYEGEFRDHFFIDGEYVGWKWYGLLKDEYGISI